MSIATQENIGDNLVEGVVAIITADGASFPFSAFGPRTTNPMPKSRAEIRAGNFIRASDQMNFTPTGQPYYNHRRGFLTCTVVSQRHTQTGTGASAKHAEAVGRFRYLMARLVQALVPAAVSGYEVVDLIDQGDSYAQDVETDTDRTEIRFQIDLVLPPASYVAA